MVQYGWSTCPPAVATQIDAFIAAVRLTLSEAVTGVYLHGSLAMDCFNPARSDLDLLVVVERSMTAQEKRRIAVQLLRISNQPVGIETSFIASQQINPWRYPTPYEFHYSEMWRQPMSKALVDGSWKSWNDAEQHDPDLAAHITILRERGVTLFGAPIRDVFAPVSPADYADYLLSDWAWLAAHSTENPVDTILNACRIYAYLRDGLITSKREGGEWAFNVLPASFRLLIETALDVYVGDSTATFSDAALRQFRAEMNARIGAFTP